MLTPVPPDAGGQTRPIPKGTQTVKIDIKGRKVIVERQVHGRAESWLTMDDKGVIRNFPTPQEVIRWVKARDRAAASRGVNIATIVEWRDVPEGFVPPEAL